MKTEGPQDLIIWTSADSFVSINNINLEIEVDKHQEILESLQIQQKVRKKIQLKKKSIKINKTVTSLVETTVEWRAVEI